MTPMRAFRERMRSRVEAAGGFINDLEWSGETIRGPRLGGHTLEIGVDHHLDEAGEVHARRPSQLLARLRAVANQVLDFGRTDEQRIERHVFVPIEPDVPKRDLDEVANR